MKRARLWECATGGVAALLLLTAGAAYAQAYPARPVKVIVPFPPGGPTDNAVRAMGQAMTRTLGQPVVVENRGGAAGAIGMEAGATAAPDGYTLVLASASTLALNPHIHKQARFNPDSYVPICMFASAPVVVTAHPSLQANDFAGVRTFAQANPGKLNYATVGIGSIGHLGGQWLRQLTGIDITHVPYKGAAGVTQAVLSGETQLGITGIGNSADFAKQGRMKIIGIAGQRRLPSLPDVPTMIEQGVPGFDLGSWFAFMAPAKTDQAIVARLHASCVQAAEQTEVRDVFTTLSLETLPPASVAELQAVIARDFKRWGEHVKAQGIKPE